MRRVRSLPHVLVDIQVGLFCLRSCPACSVVKFWLSFRGATQLHPVYAHAAMKAKWWQNQRVPITALHDQQLFAIEGSQKNPLHSTLPAMPRQPTRNCQMRKARGSNVQFPSATGSGKTRQLEHHLCTLLHSAFLNITRQRGERKST